MTGKWLPNGCNWFLSACFSKSLMCTNEGAGVGIVIGNLQKKTGTVKITTKCRLTFWKKCEISCQWEQKASLLALCRVPPRLREAKDCLHVYLIGRLAILAVRNPHLCDLLLQVLPIKFHLIPQHPKIKRKHFVSREWRTREVACDSRARGMDDWFFSVPGALLLSRDERR